MTVVRDEGDLVALWFPIGTRWKQPTTPPTRPRPPSRGERLASALALGDWVFKDAAWDVSTLSVMRAHEWHALWASWRSDGTHWGWYVNLQRPFERTRLGFQTMDLVLDVIIDVDHSWHWKDEDELELFLERGLLDAETAVRIREEGLRIARCAERNEPPFNESPPRWHPDPSWTPPKLVDGWDEPCR